jgi:hypothetical protein
VSSPQDEAFKTIMDGVSVVTVVGTLTNVLPSIAAVFTIIWTGIRIYETDTVQEWFGKKTKSETDVEQ